MDKPQYGNDYSQDTLGQAQATVSDRLLDDAPVHKFAQSLVTIKRAADADEDGVLTFSELETASKNGLLTNVDQSHVQLLEKHFDTIKGLSDDESFFESGISNGDIFKLSRVDAGATAYENMRTDSEKMTAEVIGGGVGLMLGTAAEVASFAVNPWVGFGLVAASVGTLTQVEGAEASLGVFWGPAFGMEGGFWVGDQIDKAAWNLFNKTDVDSLFNDLSVVK